MKKFIANMLRQVANRIDVEPLITYNITINGTCDTKKLTEDVMRGVTSQMQRSWRV